MPKGKHIDDETKERVCRLYETGLYTYQQLAYRLDLEMNSVAEMVRSFKKKGKRKNMFVIKSGLRGWEHRNEVDDILKRKPK